MMSETTASIPRVLTIAGTDPTGGAGIHADLKSIAAAGGYGLGVVTAIVSQNTQGVTDVFYPEASVVTAQLDAIDADVELDAVKIGMLGRVDYIEAIDTWLSHHAPQVVVIDPVMVATSGDRLLDADAEDALRNLLRHATVITPNIPELEVIAGLEEGSISSDEDAQSVAQRLAAELDTLVTVKGGHLQDDIVTNHLVGSDGPIATSTAPRIDTTSTHGTGCSLSSALATRLAAQVNTTPEATAYEDALAWVTRWLTDAIAHGAGLDVGSGHGPIDHSHQHRLRAEQASNRPWHSQSIDLSEALDSPTTAGADLLPGTIPPAGPWTTMLARLSSPILQATLTDPFLTQLREGTLDEWDFTAYQRQDALYLDRYGRALATLASRATDPEHMVVWAQGAAETVTVEQELHRTWLSQHSGTALASAADAAISPITAGYTDHLLARTSVDSYVVGAAAVLPCYWMYADIGLLMTPYDREDHPYHAWLSLYGDPEFTEATKVVIGMVEELFDAASPAERERATRAYLDAVIWEREFFDQSYRMR